MEQIEKEKNPKQKIAKLEKQIANSEEILIALNTKRQKIKESYDKKIEKLKKEQTEKLEAKDKEIAELSDSIQTSRERLIVSLKPLATGEVDENMENPEESQS